MKNADVLPDASALPGAAVADLMELQARTLTVRNAAGAEVALGVLEGTALISVSQAGPPKPPLEVRVRVFGSAAEARLGATLEDVYRTTDTGEPQPDPSWTQERNDLGNPALAQGQGASARPDPAHVMILYRHLLCHISVESRPGMSKLLTRLADAWVAKVKALQPPQPSGTAGTAVTTTPPPQPVGVSRRTRVSSA